MAHATFPVYFRLSILAFLLTGMATSSLKSQNIQSGNISGSFQTDVQAYFEDTLIGAEIVDERILSNSYLQLTYQQGNFSTGIRYEAFLNPILGFDRRFEGQGLTYRFAQYNTEKLDITVGNFYDQFGNGLVFRSYQEWMLGVDNSMDGIRIQARPTEGVYLKGLIGKQRKFYERSNGIMRGFDGEVHFHQFSESMQEKRIRLMIGGSIMNKFEKDDDPVLRLPENVTASSGRASFGYKGFTFDAEYAYKINDPFNKNQFVYNNGTAIYLNAGYSQKGLGITINAKRVDNMDFRSEREVTFQELALNFIPPSTKQHTYRLPTLYPYATQLNGEVGIQGSLIYKIPKKTALGGKYGTQIYLNYSRVLGMDTTFTDPGFIYESSFWGNSDLLYFQDINLEISKKWSRNFKTILTYINLQYNKDIVEFGSPNAGYGLVKSHIFIMEASHRLNKKRTLRWEFQHLSSQQDFGNWMMGLIEYSISPHWFFSVIDEYNYGSYVKGRFDTQRRTHYYFGSIAYVAGANRFGISAGRQRAGLLCVGGICRVVPASNGITLSINSSF